MNRLYKYLIILIGIVLLAPLRLQAASIKIDNVTLDSKSENVTVLDEPSVSGTDVSLGIKFNEINDYAKFKLEIKNNDAVDYTLVNDSYNEYLSFTAENTTIKSKKKSVVYLTVKLIKKVPVTDLDEGLFKTTISLGFKDKEGKAVIINPKTGDNLLKYLIIFIVSVIGLNIALLVLKKKNMFAILIGLLLIPFIVKAANEIAFKININFNIELNDNVVLKKVTYKVIHKKMNLDGSTYSVEEEEELEGIETYEVTPNTNNYDGFTSPTTQTVVVDSDGSTTIVYEYERNKVEVTLPDNKYITGGDSLEGEHYYGEEITLEAKDRERYDFVKWSDGSTDNPHTITLTEDLSIYPIYSAKTNIAYTVKHYKMDLDGVNYTLAETDNLNGTTDENITPNTRVYEGFNSPEKQTKKIKADGSTLIEYYYIRNKVEVNISTTTNSEYITSSLDDGEYYYGEQITLSATDREGYDFDGWSNGLTDKTIQITLTENLDIYPTYTPKTNIAYTVKHYKMDTDGVNYTLSETENLTGTTDTNVTPSVKSYDGFTSPGTQTKKINGNGSTLFEYYYTRNKVDVDLSSVTNSEYITSSLTDGEHYYGEEIVLTAVNRPGYTFTNWSDGSTDNPYTFELTGDLSIYPIYTAKTNTAYTVKHYKMDTDGVNYTLSDTDNLTGTTDTNVTAAVKDYDGFTSPGTQTKKINANGSTLFEYYYTRNKVEVDLDSLTNNEYVTSSLTDGDHYYGEEITLTAANRPGYTFTNWSDGSTDNPYTFELTGDLSIYPIYTANTNTAYTVKHYKMNLDGENYTLSETESLTGTTDTNVTPGVKTYDGFTSPSTQTKKINGNGSTLIEYYYTRNKYNLNVTDRTYLSTSSTANGKYYYETPITLSALDRVGYVFDKWSNNISSQTIQININEDIEIYPIYIANELVFNNQTLDSGVYNTAYTSNSFSAATNGTGSYTYSIKSGAPSGTTINSTNRTITLTNNVDAGTYNIVITAKDNNSNKTSDAIMTITIDRKPITFPTCSSKEYNGESQTLFNSHTSGEYTNDVISGTNVGSYSTNLTPTSNYKWNSGSDVTSARSLSCSITQKDITLTAASQSRAWNNSALTNSTCTANTDGLISGHTVSCTMTSGSTITTAGSVDNVIDTYTIKNSSNTDVTINYNVTTAKGTLTVTLATPTVSLSAKSEAQRTYTGSAISANTATVSPNSNPTITYKYYTNNVCSENETTIAPTNVGTYYVKAYASAVSGKTNAANSDCVNHSILQATATNSVSISGTNTWGQTLTATITTNSPGTKSYQWYYNDSNSTSGGTTISGATSNTYTISKDYVGKYIYVVASVGSSQNYTTSSNSTAITSTTVAKQTSCAAPTNVSISTAGVVTWTASSTASGYQISIDNSSYTDASSGVNYNSTITNATGKRIVYVRSTCDSTYYTNTNSTSVNASTNVFSVTLTKGTGIDTVSGAGNYINGSTVTLGATVSTNYVWSKWTQTSDGADVSTTNAYSNVISSNWAYTANSILDCKGFSTASWSTIKTNVSNDLGYYGVGCTKSVDLGSDLGTHTLRVANNTRPAECETSGFSQTACGFVVEFEDIITTHRMNPYSNSGNSNGDGNRGSWEYSDMRAYVNSGKYLAGTDSEIDYSSNGIYSNLPSDLQSVIIDTYVVSGYGCKDSSNFTTTDKLYLFSTKEIWGKEGTSNVINYDSAETETRQLDYYKSKNVTTSNYSAAIKKNGTSNSWWWLRTARSHNGSGFFAVDTTGDWSGTDSNYTSGVAPSFRIVSGEKYRVELNANGGSVSPTYIDVTAESSVGTLPTPTPADEFHEFIGWFTGIDTGVEVTSSYVPEGNIEVFARWNDICKGFSTDSWSTIQTNVNNDLGYYGVGCTKSVTLGSSLGTHTLRVANNTRPAECETSGFSQTACGFVVEFEDIITTHRMNPYSNNGDSNGDGNRGGWEYSEMRTYVNNDIYNVLPSDLQSVIIDTYVVSGYGSKDSSNFTTTDKIYLFSPHEIWNDVDGNTSSGIDYYDKSYNNTRQLDYYLSKNVTTSNYSAAIKKQNGQTYYWWLRSAYSNYYTGFFYVADTGDWYPDNSRITNGVTPSFRIASGEKYRVDLNANGGSVSPTYIDVTAGSSVGTLPTPTPADEFHEFLGWYTGIDTGVEVTSSYVPEENIEIFARWNTKPIGYVNRQVPGAITTGDEVAINSEHFYVVSSNSTNTVLLSKYNLYVGLIRNYNNSNSYESSISNSDPKYGLQDTLARGYVVGEKMRYGVVGFSGTNYWDNSVYECIGNECYESGTTGLSSGYTGSYNGNPYPNVYNSNMSSIAATYNYSNDATLTQNNGYTIAYYVEEYVNRLKQLGAPSTITGRLLLKEEAYSLGCTGSAAGAYSCSGNEWLYSTSYWLGSAYSYDVVFKIMNSAYLDYSYRFFSADCFGVRPVIIIKTSDI